MFCKECQKLYTIEKKNNGETLLVCESCGDCRLATEELSFSQSKKFAEVGSGIINEEEDLTGYPHICKKCGHGQSDVMTIGPARVGEADRILYKCKKCKFVERQADGTGNM